MPNKYEFIVYDPIYKKFPEEADPQRHRQIPREQAELQTEEKSE